MTTSIHPLLFGALFDIRGLEGILVPIAVFTFVGAIVISAMYFKHQRQRMWHDTARLALEKGQPLPSMPDEGGQPRKASDVKAGLVLIAVGIGLSLFFGLVDSSRSGGFHSRGFMGAIPALIGVALLLYGFLTGQLSKNQNATDRRPPLT
jgi:hypothetical protein